MGEKLSIKNKGDLTFYEIVEIINRSTHLDCLSINRILHNSGVSSTKLIEKVNVDSGFLIFIINEILCKVFSYEEKTQICEEEIELAKAYPFKISIDSDKSKLVVYKQEGRGRLGFHIDPYNFDSTDEKELFSILRQELEKDECITDIYFTGGVTNQLHNDFYFEYYNPTDKKIRKYFPDFLIETSKGRYLVVEVKDAKSKANYDANKMRYNGKTESLSDEVFSKEIGFNEFRELNQQFEYKIVFDAKMKEQQTTIMKKINTCINSFVAATI